VNDTEGVVVPGPEERHELLVRAQPKQWSGWAGGVGPG
jgi:hypothetical protein